MTVWAIGRPVTIIYVEMPYCNVAIELVEMPVYPNPFDNRASSRWPFGRSLNRSSVAKATKSTDGTDRMEQCRNECRPRCRPR